LAASELSHELSRRFGALWDALRCLAKRCGTEKIVQKVRKSMQKGGKIRKTGKTMKIHRKS
jgi:hypothetical protein